MAKERGGPHRARDRDDRAAAGSDELLAAYAGLALDAFREVESALASARNRLSVLLGQVPGEAALRLGEFRTWARAVRGG